ISLQRSMHSSQMYTPGPAISFLTCFWLFPQNEHLRRSPPSPNFATGLPLPCPARERSADAGRCRHGGPLPAGQDLVDDAVLPCFGRAHDEVAVRVTGDLLHRLLRVVREQLIEQLAHPDDLLRLDLDVDSLALRAAVRLVDQDPRVGQREPLALRT